MAAECASAQREERPCARGFDDGCAEHLEQAEVHEAFAAMFATVPDEGYLSSMARALRAEGYAIDPFRKKEAAQVAGKRGGGSPSTGPGSFAATIRKGQAAVPSAVLRAVVCRGAFAVARPLRRRRLPLGRERSRAARPAGRRAAVRCGAVPQGGRLRPHRRRRARGGRGPRGAGLRAARARPVRPGVSAEMESQANTAFFKSFARCLCDAVCAEGAAIGA